MTWLFTLHGVELLGDKIAYGSVFDYKLMSSTELMTRRGVLLKLPQHVRCLV